MIVFESILNTFDLSVIFKPSGAVVNIGLILKPSFHMQI